jgi:hypothetical protein
MRFAPLMALLDRERRLVLDGKYEEIGALQADKARLMSCLEEGAESATLARLRSHAETNLALLAAAREGFASARARLRELERLARGAGAYDRTGGRVGAPADPRTSRRV